MPPKEEPPKKKLSAKEKKRLKEQQKREELERRTKEAAEWEFRVHEKERKVQEQRDKSKRHGESVTSQREDQRLAKEVGEFQAVWANFVLRMDLALREYEKHQEWHNIVLVSPLPSVNDEADINAFLAVWREGEDEIPSGEVKKRDIDKDFEIIRQAVQLVTNIHQEMDQVRQSRSLSAAVVKDRIGFHKRHLIDLYSEIQATIDRLTASIMQYFDKYNDDTDDQAVTLCKNTPDVKFGLWCGNKAARVRSVEFSPLYIVISPKDGAHLPKQMNLMNSVAMRVQHYTIDPLSVHEPEDVGMEYYALGGVVVVETLAVPQGAKRVKEWVLRNETNLAHDVQRIPYPPAADAANATAAPPIRVSFQVPQRVVVRKQAPLMGLWNEQRRCWSPEGTSDYNYDHGTRRATFLTYHLAPMAIIQERGFDVPYERWYMYPVTYESVVFVIECKKRHTVSDREVHILVRNNLCRVLQPEERELEWLREEWFEPATLLRHLANAGYNFVLRDCDSMFTPDTLPKTWALENKGYDDLSMLCTTFEFSSTRHNKNGEDPEICLFRVSRQMHEDDDEPLRVDLEDDEKWHTVRYERDRCVLTQCKESDEIANVEELSRCETHLNLYMVMSAEFSQDVIDSRIDSGDLLLQSAVKQLLMLVRPFTWG